MLIDAARQLILPSIPEDSINERREALLRASNYALTKGVTAVVDVGRYIPGSSVELSWEDFTGLVVSKFCYLYAFHKLYEALIVCVLS